MCKKVALVTGVTGQDGSYLVEFLLNKGYEVHGIKEEHHFLIQIELITCTKILMRKISILSSIMVI